MASLWLVAALGLAVQGAYAQEPAATQQTRTSNKWRIGFDETARSDGSIDFLVSPVGGDPITVSVTVTSNQTDELIAGAAFAAFAAALGNKYEVEVDDRHDVLIKKANRQVPDFGLALVRLTADDVEVDLDRE